MEAKALEILIQDGESATVEFKVAVPRYAELADRLCGMANGLGGYLIIGVADKTWDIVGIKNISDTLDTILQASRHCKPALRLDPEQPQLVEVQGKKIMVAHVPPNDGRLYQSGGVFWIRRGTHTVPLESDEIENFFHRRGTLSWEKRPVELATLDDLDLGLVQVFAERRLSSRSREGGRRADLETLLQKSGCAIVVREAGSNEPVLRPTNAGLLLFGQEPQEFLMQSEVICVLYGDNLGVRRYLDRRNLHGTLTRQIDQAEEFLKRNIQVAARTEGFHRIDEPDFPLEALREAVVNAVVHRDYSLSGEAVRIFFYNDRIEIHSPGLLLPGLRLEELKQGRTTSWPRNPVLANVLRELPGGYMERLGSGISFMINEMRLLHRPDPEFREQHEFIVTFYKEPVTAAGDQEAAGLWPVISASPVQESANVTAKITADQLQPSKVEVSPPAESNLIQSRRQEIALLYIREHGVITNAEYRALTGISESTAMRDLEVLVTQGTLRAIGKKRGRKYMR